MMDFLKALLSWIIGIPERFMRFWFPYLFYFDEDNPEPRERESWSEKRRRRKREKKQEKIKAQSKDKGSVPKAKKKPQRQSIDDDVFEFSKDELGVKVMDVNEPFDAVSYTHL